MSRLKKGEFKSGKSMSLPMRFYPVGETFYSRGKEYRVILRGSIEIPRDACLGCALASGGCPEDVACSRYDRKDGVSVWFEEV